MDEVLAPGRQTTTLRSLHPMVRNVWRLGGLFSGLISAAVATAFAALLTKVANGPIFVVAGIVFVVAFFLFGGLGMLLVDKQFEHWRYQLRDHDILIKKGLVWRSERYIARDRVQHIDINAGPLDRKFGLVQVVVYAAGISGSVGLIPGLTPDEGEWLKEQLLATRAEDA